MVNYRTDVPDRRNGVIDYQLTLTLHVQKFNFDKKMKKFFMLETIGGFGAATPFFSF